MREYPEEALRQVDGFEAYKAHNGKNQSRAADLGVQFNKPLFAGSDAHFLKDIGYAWNEFDIDFEAARDLEKLKEVFLTRNTPSCHKGPALSPYISRGIGYSRRSLKYIRHRMRRNNSQAE